MLGWLLSLASASEPPVEAAFVDRLVAEVTAGFKGDVGVVPRQFLREFATVLDLVQDEPDYMPDEAYAIQGPTNPTPEEEHALSGTKPVIEAEGEDLVPAEDAW